MFKNPLKKYRPGGSAPSQEQQQKMAEFIQWLPTRIKEFKGTRPEQIAEAINELWASDEGKKQVMSWWEQFNNETKGVTSAFAGGKLHDFICKHSRGGYIQGCSCGSKVPKGEDGIPDGIGAKFKSLYDRFIGVRVPNSGSSKDRRIYTWTDKNGKHVRESANVNGNASETYIDVPVPGDTIIKQKVFTHPESQRIYNWSASSPEGQAILGRNRQYIPEDKCGGNVKKPKK